MTGSCAVAPRRARRTGLKITLPAADPIKELDGRVDDDLQQSENEAQQFLRSDGRLSVAARTIVGVLRDQSDERVSLAASGAAFWLVISAFPTGVAVVSIYGLFVNPKRVASNLGVLAGGVPGSLGSLLTAQLRRVAATDHAHLSLGLALSLALALFSASSGFNNLDGAIRLAYRLPSQRYLAARKRAFVGALAVVVLLGLLAVGTPVVVRRPSTVVTMLAGAVLAVAITAGVGALYRYSVGTHISARSLLPGALLSAVAMALVSVGFGAYVSASTHFTAVYGAFAGAVVAMLAIYLAVYGVLLGAALNAQLDGTPGASGGQSETLGPPSGGAGEEQARSMHEGEDGRATTGA
jgi:membrane protein